jgi:hypothetical protein
MAVALAVLQAGRALRPGVAERWESDSRTAKIAMVAIVNVLRLIDPKFAVSQPSRWRHERRLRLHPDRTSQAPG